MNKPNERGNAMLLVIVVIVIAVGGYFYLNSTKPTGTSETNQAETEPAMEKDESMMMEEDEMTGGEMLMMEGGTMVKDETAMEMDEATNAIVVEAVMEDVNAVSGTLSDVTGGDSTGTAYILRKDGKLYHYVSATLPQPTAGSVYEGWLVQQTPELMFFSTGAMTLGEDGAYSLSYMSDNAYEGYDYVVITEETVLDETPEAHVLEGSL